MEHFFTFAGAVYIITCVLLGMGLRHIVVILSTDLYNNAVRLFNPMIQTGYAGLTTLLFYLPLCFMLFVPHWGMVRLVVSMLLGMIAYILLVLVALQDTFESAEQIHATMFSAMNNYLVHQEPTWGLFLSAWVFRWLIQHPVLG